MFYPNAYFNKVEEITIEFLQRNKIKALILDIDNTLIDYNHVMTESVEKWARDLKGHGVKLYIVSNTSKKKKVEKVAGKLDIPYVFFAKKPLKIGFKKAQKYLKENSENIAVVGDQIFTDVIGGNRAKMFTILVEPINEKDFWYTKWKRPIERRIKENFMKRTKEK